jgi:quercetin dioxygenase-like cupin family protein
MQLYSSPIRHGLMMAALAAGTLATAPLACAGSCPAGATRPDGTGQERNAAAAKGLTDTVLSSIDLAKEPAKTQGRLLRLRRLVVEPGGVVPWHEHANRPALIYIISGEITEYASTCAVPIVHRAGESATETHATAHWWKNTGAETVVLLSADLFPTAGANEHMM